MRRFGVLFLSLSVFQFRERVGWEFWESLSGGCGGVIEYGSVLLYADIREGQFIWWCSLSLIFDCI